MFLLKINTWQIALSLELILGVMLEARGISLNDMVKFDFLPDLHHVYSKVAFFASYEQLQSQIFKNWTFRPHLVPPKGSNRGWYGIYGSSVGYHASNTSPSSKRGKIFKISLGIFIVLEITHACKKSCLWHNLQSFWNGVPLRHTHGENRYSEGMGIKGLSPKFWLISSKISRQNLLSP